MFCESSLNHPAPRKADSAMSVEKKILLEMPFQIKKVSISETGFSVTDPPLP